MPLFYATNSLSNTVWIFNLGAESVVKLTLLLFLCGAVCLCVCVCVCIFIWFMLYLYCASYKRPLHWYTSMLIKENWSPPPQRYGFRVHIHKIVSLCCGTVLLNYLLVLPVSPRALHIENLETHSPLSLSKQGKVVWNSSLNQHFLYGTVYGYTDKTDKTKLLNNKTETCEQNVLCKPSALVSRTTSVLCDTWCLIPKERRSWLTGNVWLWPNKGNVHECHMTVHA